MAYHGYPRFTGDTEFFVRPSIENAERVMEVLREFGFGGVGIELEDLTTPGRVIQLGRPPNRIDLLTGISGVGFDEAWRGREEIDVDGVPLVFIGRTELITNKRASGRTKDLADAEELERSVPTD